MYSLKTCAIGIGMSKNLYVCSTKPFWAFLPVKTEFIFLHSISNLEAIFVP